MDIVTLGAALNGSAEYVNSHFKGGSNIQIVDNPDGTQTINASGEVSSEDTVARAEIAAIKDGTNIDSFGDVETALGDKADTSTTYTKTEVDTALSAKANSADVYSKTAVDTALSNKADKSTTYTKTEVDTSLSNKADKSTTYTKTEVDTALDDKVDKETGKGLSTNDYTTAEKTKLGALAEIKSIGTGLSLDSSTGELTATGGGSGGTTDYRDLSNKPQINSVTLSGNKSLSDLGITDTTYSFADSYDASTNKGATVATITNAINALDVTGVSNIAASKTISAWSETDGKVSVSTQDIAIAGTQTTLTGYTSESPAKTDTITASDTVNSAIKKLDERSRADENNISLLGGGGRNVFKYTNLSGSNNEVSYVTNSDGSITVTVASTTAANRELALTEPIENTFDTMKISGSPAIATGDVEYLITGLKADGTYQNEQFSYNAVVTTINRGTPKIKFSIYVKTGTAAGTYTFYPMIQSADNQTAFSTFTPYIPTLADIAEMLNQ